VYVRVTVHSENQDSTKEKTEQATALSRNLRLAVPVVSVLMLILLGTVIYLPTDITHLFVPVYVLMVVVYVFTSIYMFKTLVDKETPSHQ